MKVENRAVVFDQPQMACDDDDELVDGVAILTPRVDGRFPDARLEWIVDERGGGLLIAGFALGIIGLIWRLPACRREIALTWGEDQFRLVGTSEFFPQRFERELATIADLLADPPPALGLSPGKRQGKEPST